MAPKQQELETRISERISDLIGWTNNEMIKLSPHRAALEAAGLTNEDMAGVILVRDKNGQYTVRPPNDNAATIENVINTNPELRAMYEAAWQRTNPTSG